MSYAGIQMFMAKLKQLIVNCNDIPFITHNNNPEIIISQRPQLQLLFDELESIIQILGFIDQHQDLDRLKKRFADAAEEAQYIVDLFLSGVHNRSQHHDDVRKYVLNLFYFNAHVWKNSRHLPTSEVASNPSLNLDDVMRSFKFIQEEIMSIRIDNDNMKMDSSQTIPNQSQISISTNSHKKLLDEIVVGLDRDAQLIIEKLVADYPKKLDVVSVVGMGGIGKTTLATMVFNDPYVKHHFYIRVWVTVSQTFDKRAVLIQILASIGVKENLEKADDSRLRELVHKRLIGQRYLIVIDDIWHIETWDNLKLFFPHDNNGSRILLTTRLTEVAKHANSDGLIHHLGYLNEKGSWELLFRKVFRGNECPEWSIKPGTQIIENCQGLPLAVVVIAGVLAKEAWSEKIWVHIAERTSSYIVSKENGCLETLALSYDHLPVHLRECFLYLGGFPEDYMFDVQRLIWLWVAEGFIKEDGNRSLEDIAEGYLLDLIDRNLVIIAARRNSDGAVKACKVHDLLRELCVKKAKEEQFTVKIDNVIIPPHKPGHMFLNGNFNILDFPYGPAQNLRSILCFTDFKGLSDDIARYFGTFVLFGSFVLLRVLHLQECRLLNIPKGMELLVHLRYLAIWTTLEGFPSSICNLWGLQTLIYINGHDGIDLPGNISDLENLRHLWSFEPYHSAGIRRIKKTFILSSIEKPMKLQTISNVVLGSAVDNFQKCFPYIKELRCGTCLDEENDFKSLTYLEKLKLTDLSKSMNHITFPATLKALTLARCHLPWSDMSIIQQLPNLKVLKLKDDAFEGSRWNTNEQVFRQLKFLRLEMLDIKQWEVYSTSFPCLKQLDIFSCNDLEETPLEIGDLPMLELIQIRECRNSVGESVRRIEEEQQDMGNYSLKIHILEDIGSSEFSDD